MIVLQLHVKEIQYRCVYLGLAYLLAFVYAFETADIYLFTLLYSLGVGQTQCTYIGEAFTVSLLLAILVAGIFTLPYGIYMVRSYIRPGIRRRAPEGKPQCIYALPGYLARMVSLLIVFICICKSVPVLIHYFLSYADRLQTVSSYLLTQPRLLPTVSFSLRIFVSFICICMCFCLIMRYYQSKLSHLHTIRYSFRPYVYLLVILFASIIAPPEGYLQICITCILFVAIEVSIFMAMYNHQLYYTKMPLEERT